MMEHGILVKSNAHVPHLAACIRLTIADRDIMERVLLNLETVAQQTQNPMVDAQSSVGAPTNRSYLQP
jgi:hypothetical protein